MDFEIEPYLIKNLYKRSGQHVVIGGITGSGKTQLLYYIMENLIVHHPKEKIIWFDTGKSGEILQLSTFKKPLRIFIPEDADHVRTVQIERRANVKEFLWEVFSFSKPNEIFDNLLDDGINIISLEPYYQDDTNAYTKHLDEFFKILFKRAMNYSLKPPLAIFIDELHSVAPSQGNSFNEEHMQAGVRFQRNIERLRSAGVRIIGAIQDWTKLRRGVRTAFQWIVIKRGLSFSPKDLPQLAKYNQKWWSLDIEASAWVFPNRDFHNDYLITPFYGDGRRLGKVYYLEEENKSKSIHPHPDLSQVDRASGSPSSTPVQVSAH